MVNLVNPNIRAHIARQTASGGSARADAVNQISKSDTGVAAFDELALGFQSGAADEAARKAMLAKPIPVNYRGPLFDKRR
jgi:hypothetical protein